MSGTVQPRRMERRLLHVSVLLTAAFAGVAAGAPAATADANDDAYLAALHHGGLCCPEQMDMPISYSDPSSEISDGHRLANTMKESVTAQDAYPGGESPLLSPPGFRVGFV